MFELIDTYLLRRHSRIDDNELQARRILGETASEPVIYFLPCSTSFRMARIMGLIGDDFLACYEMPPALTSADPNSIFAALRLLLDDAKGLIASRGIPERSVRVVGYSLGSYPACFLANHLRTRLVSIAPADRGDLMIWESRASEMLRRRARANGFDVDDFVRILRGYNPIENLQHLAPESTFIFGKSDPFVPEARSSALMDAIRTSSRATGRDLRIIEVEGGHLRTLVSGARLVLGSLTTVRPTPQCMGEPVSVAH